MQRNMDDSIQIGEVARIRAYRAAVMANASPAVRARIEGKTAPVVLPVAGTPVREPSVRYTRAQVDKMIEDAVKKALEREASIQAARKAAEGTKGPSVADVLHAVSAATGFTIPELTGPCRRNPLGHARKIVYYLLRCKNMSFPNIGRAVGSRDHTTTLHGFQRFLKLRNTPPISEWIAHPALAPLVQKADAI
jgi:hypothetical protein